MLRTVCLNAVTISHCPYGSIVHVSYSRLSKAVEEHGWLPATKTMKLLQFFVVTLQPKGTD